MRFKRADVPGILIATLAPAGLLLLVLGGYDLWDHHGTPLLPVIAGHLAIGAGLIGAFSRFISHWGLVGSLIAGLLAAIVAVMILQQTGNDGTTVDTSLRLLAAGLFVLLNIVVLREFLWYGLGPVLGRRDERRAEESQ